MKDLLLDTSIIIDLLAKREPYYDEAARLFSMADKKVVSLNVSALTFANTNYLLLEKGKNKDAKRILQSLQRIVNVLSIDEQVVERSRNDEDFADYEDALQYYTALEHGMEGIVTRNLKHFRKGKLPVMTAAQILQIINS